MTAQEKIITKFMKCKLHAHPKMQSECNVNAMHIIIDKEAWEVCIELKEALKEVKHDNL